MKSLFEINNDCKTRLSNLESYELIEKIIFNEDETKEIGNSLKKLFQYDFSWEMIYSYKELISIFLVSCAKYYYNDGEGGFWQSVQNLTDIYEITKRQKLIKAFNTVLSYYKLNKFEDYSEEGYRNIAPIIAHSGLPNNLTENLLNNLSLLLGQDISYNDIGDEALFTFRYASKNVRRYLKTLSQNGLLNDFILEIINAIKSKKSTIDEASSLSVSLQENIIKWCDNQTNNLLLKNYKSFKQPIIKYDINANTLLLETPEMAMTSNSLCVWEIFDGHNYIQKKVYGEYIKGEYYFRSASIVLNSATEIRVKLFNDLNELSKEFVLKEKNEFLTFNYKGNVNKSKFILNTGAYILINDKYCTDTQIELVSNFGDCNLFYQKPTDDLKTIKFVSDESDEIVIKVKRPFGFVYNNRTISDNCEFETLDAFSVLPEIQVPINGEWQITILINDVKDIKNLFVEDYIIDFAEIFDKNCYGEISLRLYNSSIGYKTLKFLYLPYVEIKYEQYNPLNNGYKNSKITFITNGDSNILDEKHEIVKQITIPKEMDVFIGYYRYKNEEYKFKFITKPFKWVFESDNKLLGQPNKKLYLSVKDLTLNGNSVLNMYNNTAEDLWVKLDNHLGTKAVCIRKNSKAVINLLEYIEFISAADGNCLIYIEQNYFKICELCDIRINISIRNFRDSKIGNTIIFQWDEDGACKNRQMVFRYLSKPYEFFSIPIKDKDLMAYIDDNDERLVDNCIVEIVANHEQNIFSTNNKKDLVDENNYKILQIKNNDFSNLKFTDGNLQDFKNAIYTYLVYRFNKKIFFSDVEFKNVLKLLIKYIIRSRFIFGDEELLKILFEYDLSSQQFDIIAKDLGLYIPILNDRNNLDRMIFTQLLDYNKYLYFIFSCLKRDEEQLDKILENGFGFINNFKDSEDYLWAKKYNLFPNIDSIEYFNDKIKYLKKLPFYSNKKEEYLILMILVELVTSNSFKNEINDLNLLICSSRYIKNLYDAFPKTLIMEVFQQTSRKKEK